MNAREGPGVIQRAVRLMLEGAERDVRQPPRLVLVLTPNRDWFMDKVEEVNPGKEVRRIADGTVAVGSTVYRHIRNIEQARGYDRSTPLILAHWWHYCEGSALILDRFEERA
jgi:hypothetical protein